MTRARAQRRSRRVLLAVVATAVSLLLAEGAARLLERPDTSFEFMTPNQDVGEVFLDFGTGVRPDPELLWCFEPGSRGGLVNHLGLRGWWPRRPKAGRDFRIACVGDSCTFGSGVRYERTYGVQLERLLQAARPDLCVESILAGIPGYSVFQSRVLWHKYVEATRPDLTVLYCGAWNDYLPAIRASDAERSRYLARPSRLLAMLSSVFARPYSSDTDAYKKAFRRGEAPDGRRVPLAEFRQDLEHLVRRARAVRSAVIAVVPPIPSDTLAKYPIGERYQEAVQQVAERLEVPLVDGRALLAKADEKAFFVDWVHPSADGHRQLAEALAARARTLLAARPRLPVAALASIDRVVPAAFPALAAPELSIEGSGFAAPDAFDRLWVGGLWVQHVEVVDDDRLRASLQRVLPPGEQVVELVTAGGSVRAPAALHVGAARLPAARAELRATGEGLRIEARCPSPLDCLGAVWVARAVRAEPHRTQYGAFCLRSAGGAEPPARRGDFRFDQVPLFRVMGYSGPGGLTLDGQLPAELTSATVLYAQVLVADKFDPSVGALSDVLELRPPK